MPEICSFSIIKIIFKAATISGCDNLSYNPMVSNKKGKGNFISSFISSWMTRKWWLGLKRECFVRKEYIYTRNLEKDQREEILK